MKYNPDFHANVVDNYRRAYKAKYGSTSILSDKRIWEIHEDCAFTQDPDEDTLESMKEEEWEQTKKGGG